MKCAFVHDHIFPEKDGIYYESSGFDEAFVERYLNLLGDVIIISRKCLYKDNKGSERILNREGLSFYALKSTRELLNKRVIETIKSNIRLCDLIVVRLPSVIGLVVIKLCKELNKPYLIEVVGCPWDSLYIKGPLYILPAFIYMQLMKKAISRSENVIYVSEEFLQKRYPTKGKWIACSNVTLENYGDFDIEKRYSKIRDYDKNKEIVIGTCAAIDAPYKSQEDVMKAVSILRQEGFPIRYEMVGGGSRERLLRIAKNLNVESNVVFLGQLPHKKVFEWYDTIDICVHPSKQEGLCRAIVEAMSRGCPIIAADAGGIHEQISEECIFEKGNVKQIINIIKSQNIDKLLSYSCENYKNAKKYSSRILYPKRNQFYSDILSSVQKK